MKQHPATLTSKGQITIPVEVRQRLGLKRGDRVIFEVADHEVILRRGASVVAATAGVLKSQRPPLSAEGLRAAAETAAADAAALRANDAGHTRA